MLTRNDTHIVLPKQHVGVEDAVRDFESLGLDLVTAPTGSHTVGSRSLFFFNTQNADASDVLALRDMAENGTGADILAISSESQREYRDLMQGHNWSGIWSAIVDDGNESVGYQGNFSESAVEFHGGLHQIRHFGGQRGSTVYNSTTHSFYYDPGDVLTATANATALPGAAPSAGFLHQRLPPPPERWVLRNLSSPQAPAFESSQTTYVDTGEFVDNLREDVFIDGQQNTYKKILKKAIRKGDIAPQGFSKFRIQGMTKALGIAGVVIIWDTWGDAVVAYRQGEFVYMALLILDGLVDVAEITYTIVRMTKLSPLSKALGIATFAVGLLFGAYLIAKAFEADTALETEFFLIQGFIVIGESAVLLIPFGVLVQLVTLGVTWILAKLGILPGPMGIVELFATLYYWSNGCTTPGERIERLEEIQGHLDEISPWLEETLNAHAERGELAFFVGGLSLVSEARELADGKC